MDTIVYFLIASVAGLMYVVGTWFAPQVRNLREEVSYWRGTAGEYKKQAMKQTKGEDNLVDMIISQFPEAKPYRKLLEQYLSDPELMKKILPSLSGQKQQDSGNKPPVTWQ